MAKLPKKPKAPKESASVTTWENYKTRVADWKKKCAKIEGDKKRKKSLIASLKKS